ncbi:MAG: DUF3387 domain-containing protein [Clostridiaceae bacterium]|nr:DUF3387 domain-containing protein [Clostridiaceae bacterium]
MLVKKLLKRYGYPPDKQEKATLAVLDQVKLLCRDRAENKSLFRKYKRLVAPY